MGVHHFPSAAVKVTDSYLSQLTSTRVTGPDPAYSPDGSGAAYTPGETGAGTVVGGRYVLRVAVGTGGMGTVWQATDLQLNRQVAVKEVVPPPGIAPEDREAMYRRMMREARAAASLSHPSIVQVYDVVTDGGRPWVVMELLDARSLSDIVLQDGPLAPRAVAKIGVALLGALEVAHAANVLHRDVKPANVLVCTDGRCVLTDFGVARMPSDQQLTTPGMVLGSPHFISPERALGQPFGPPSDLFSLGVTLYLSVEGRPPFDRGEPIATMHAVVEDPVPPPLRAGPLAEVLYGLLEKDPARRWDAPTAREKLRELLAGPLASPTPQFPTDPYSMVPSQRLPWQGGAPQERIGGRALLAPGESPTDRVGAAAPADRGSAPATAGRVGPATPAGPPAATGGDDTAVFAVPSTVDQEDPYAVVPDPYSQTPDAYSHHQTPDAYPHHAAEPLPVPAPRRPEPPGLTTGRTAAGLAPVTDGLRHVSDRALTAVRRTPRPVLLAAGAGLAALVLIVALVVTIGGRDEPPQQQTLPPTTPPSEDPSADQPLLEVQEYAGRGVVVNLPAGWQGRDNPDLVYIDFVDPSDARLAIRLVREQWSGSAQGLVEVAEQNIQRNPGCAEPYQRVGLSELELAGRTGALLEYTCGSGEDMRRARWATVVQDGVAYSVRLTVPADQFDQRSVIFDELVRSFRVTD